MIWAYKIKLERNWSVEGWIDRQTKASSISPYLNFSAGRVIDNLDNSTEFLPLNLLYTGPYKHSPARNQHRFAETASWKGENKVSLWLLMTWASWLLLMTWVSLLLMMTWSQHRMSTFYEGGATPCCPSEWKGHQSGDFSAQRDSNEKLWWQFSINIINTSSH